MSNLVTRLRQYAANLITELRTGRAQLRKDIAALEQERDELKRTIDKIYNHSLPEEPGQQRQPKRAELVNPKEG